MYTIDFQKPIHVHFIGIGGISMSGLAEILLNRHFTVTGSDMQSSDMTKHLEETGAKVVIGQKAENITDDIDLVVYTAAIHESNEEFAAAKNKGVPMMTRAALLGQIMANFAKSIAVAEHMERQQQLLCLLTFFFRQIPILRSVSEVC